MKKKRVIEIQSFFPAILSFVGFQKKIQLRLTIMANIMVINYTIMAPAIICM